MVVLQYPGTLKGGDSAAIDGGLFIMRLLEMVNLHFNHRDKFSFSRMYKLNCVFHHIFVL